MKILDFKVLCGEFMLDPDLVLENENIREALSERDDKAVRHILETEF